VNEPKAGGANREKVLEVAGKLSRGVALRQGIGVADIMKRGMAERTAASTASSRRKDDSRRNHREEMNRSRGQNALTGKARTIIATLSQPTCRPVIATPNPGFPRKRRLISKTRSRRRASTFGPSVAHAPTGFATG